MKPTWITLKKIQHARKKTVNNENAQFKTAQILTMCYHLPTNTNTYHSEAKQFPL